MDELIEKLRDEECRAWAEFHRLAMADMCASDEELTALDLTEARELVERAKRRMK